MTGYEWLAAGILTFLLSLILWGVQSGKTSSKEKLDKLDKKITDQGKEHGEALTEIKLGLRDCVKWSDLDKELGPVRDKMENHDHRLTVMETECKARHGK
jgi:hypothetical protein